MMDPDDRFEQLLTMAEKYTQQILKTSLVLHGKEQDEKKKQTKIRKG
jgi:hypothetical protein